MCVCVCVCVCVRACVRARARARVCVCVGGWLFVDAPFCRGLLRVYHLYRGKSGTDFGRTDDAV